MDRANSGGVPSILDDSERSGALLLNGAQEFRMVFSD